MRLNLLPTVEPIISKPDLTEIQRDLLVSNQIFLNEDRIKVKESINGQLSFETPNSHFKFNSTQIEFYAKDQLEFRYLNKDALLFPPDFNKVILKPSHLTVKNGIQNVNKIRSPIDQNLEISVNNQMNIRGNNGLRLDGKFINLKSDLITINSLNSTINFESSNGDIYFLFNKNTRSSKSSDIQDESDDNMPSKLCICGNTGLIFKLEMKDKFAKCSDVRFPVSSNPCTLFSRSI